PFQDAYAIEGGYTAVVVLNFIIAIGMLFSPFLLSKFCEGAIVGMGSGLVSAGARAATGFVMPKAGALAAKMGEKGHHAIKPYIPTRQSVYRGYKWLASKPFNKTNKCLIFFAPLLAHAQ